MVANKHFTKIIIAVMAAAVILCFLTIGYSGKLSAMLGGTGVKMEYETKLFNTDEVMQVDIQMDEDSWNQMLAGAMSEEYYVCDVVINGLRVNNVAIRPKGNTSLSAIAMDPNSDRYSLKLEFDHFVDGQTCYGLDKLILNNNYADATNMKEAVIYDMYQYLGADASLYNYAEVSVNGEYWGVYLALEGVEQSFMLRNYGTQDGELYKPDSMDMSMGGSGSSSSGDDKASPGGFPGGGGSFPGGGGSGRDQKDQKPGDSEGGDGTSGQWPGSEGDFDPSKMEDFDPSEMGDFDPSEMGDFDPSEMGDFDPSEMGDFDPSEKGGGGGGGFSMSRGGTNLNYTGDDLDNYSTIWESEITKTGTADHKRVVEALKNISEGTGLETYLDVDNILKYMAVHTFAVNMDSLSGSMAHNYYLYEYDGQLNILPWDYNLSFGGMTGGGASGGTEVVNDAIDTPFSGTKFFDALLADEEYLARYHEYLQQLVDEYVNGGRFDEVYNRIRSQIDSLVETDPTAFYNYDEYQNAAQILYETIQLRAESIKGQLNGTIPSTDAGQRQNQDALIDASHIDVDAMGQFNMGGFSSSKDEDATDTADSDDAQTSNGFGGGFPGGFGGGGFGGGDMPNMGDFDPENIPEGFDLENMPEGFSFGDGEMPDNMPSGGFSFGGGGMPGMGGGSSSEGKSDRPTSFSGMPGQSANQATGKNLLTIGLCLVAMAAALLIVKFCVRKK